MSNVRNKTDCTILPMPLITRAYHPDTIMVSCEKSLRSAVLSGHKMITISSYMDMDLSRVYVSRVLDSIKLR